MKTIGDILSRDLTKQIEEVIQVNQTDEDSVYSEIDEYVATDRIKEHYRELLRAMADAPSEPTEGGGNLDFRFLRFGKILVCQKSWLRLEQPAVARRARKRTLVRQLTGLKILTPTSRRRRNRRYSYAPYIALFQSSASAESDESAQITER